MLKRALWGGDLFFGGEALCVENYSGFSGKAPGGRVFSKFQPELEFH